ncbi:TraB/GumN family protein [Flavobacterium sp. J27]|uniref:TraB/GumN family protein n=1 Tax=Flavobacterium sp. J27 TaxID=2060419 RepID=UPI001031967D|nr:TraB/GumN family protein [Flavobacterium sp. J27]
MKKAALTFTLLICSFLFGQTENSMLWEISGNGLQKKSFLYGTMHVSDKVSYNLSDSFFDALLNSDIVANESNPETWGTVSNLMKEKEYIYSAQLYHSFYIKPMSKNNVIAMFNNKSHFFYNYLSLSENKNADYEENAVLDMFISQAGRKYNKEITGLEDAVASMIPILQINATDATPKEENIQLLYKILKRKSFGEATVDFYREKNITILDSIYKLAFSKKAHEALIINRNKVMVDSIASISKRGSLFAAVGAAHLAGKEGIINLLIQKGYTVTPVFSQLTEKGEKQKKEIETFFKKPTFTTFTSPDKMLEIPLLANEITEEGVIGSPDYANGGLIRIIRNNHNYFINSDSSFYNSKSLDSLFYENIPGTILSKEFVEKEGISYFDIKNKTKTGNYQRYRFYITPLEIIMVSMSGLNNYTTLFENDVFEKINLKKPNNNWEELNARNASFTVTLPSFYSIRENDNNKSNSHTIESYLKEDNSFYFVMERNLNDNRTLENTLFEHKQIHYQFYLQHGIDSTQTSFQKNTFLSESNIGSRKINLKSFISGNKYYLLGTVNASETNKNQFFNSFQLKNNSYKENFITYTDSTAFYKITIPEKQNQKLFLNITKENKTSENTLSAEYNDYTFKSASGKTVSLEINKFHAYESIKNLDTIKQFFKDYVLDKKDNMYDYNDYSYDYDDYDEYSDNETSLLNYNVYSKKGLKMSTWWKLFKPEEEPKIILKENETQDSEKYTYEALVSRKKASQAVKYKLVFDTDRYYILQTLVPKEYQNDDPFIENTFNSFEILPFPKKNSVFETKTTRFINDASSANDTLRKNAFSSIYKLDFSESDFEVISYFINKYNFKKSELFAKNNLLKKLGYLKNKNVIPFLEKTYKQENSNSETQISVLIALSNQNTKESYQKIIELLEYDLPLSDNQYDITSLFSNFSRNPEHAKELFPNIFQFYSIKEYQNPLLSFCYKLLDKDYITLKKIKAFDKMILTNAKLEFKRIKSWKTNNIMEDEEKDPDDYYEEEAPVTDIITFLNIIYKFPKDKNRDEFISKISALNIAELNIELLRLRFISNTISNEAIKKGLENPNTAFTTIQLLTNKNMSFEIEDDSIAWAALHNFYDIKKTDSITFISKKIADYNKEKIVFYFYSVKEKDDTSFDKNIRTIAFFMKGDRINPSAFTSLYSKKIQEDDSLEEKLDAIIKESLNSNHLRASYEKDDEENYIPNYLYDDY